MEDVMEDVSEDGGRRTLLRTEDGGRCSYTNVSYIEVSSNKVKQDF